MSMMERVKNHFGLMKVPFSKAVGVKELFPSRELKEACARLEIALENEDVALLTGLVGSGKSSVLRAFTQGLDSALYRVAYIPAMGCGTGEIAKLALAALQMQVPFHSHPAVRKLKEAVHSLHSHQGVKTIILIDEAQELPLKTLVSLKNLLNFHMDNENLLLLILCGQRELSDTLALSPLESLNRRIRIRFHMRGLSLEETSRYISHQMKICGVDKTVFTDDVKSQIFSISKGVISHINRLCFELLLYAASLSKDIIEPSMIDKIDPSSTSTE